MMIKAVGFHLAFNHYRSDFNKVLFTIVSHFLQTPRQNNNLKIMENHEKHLLFPKHF